MSWDPHAFQRDRMPAIRREIETEKQKREQAQKDRETQDRLERLERAERSRKGTG
jgi:hypothetical protein